MVEAVSSLPPVEVVRLIFEARAAGDVRRVLALMDPDVRAAMGPTDDHVVEGVAAVRRYLARESAEGPRVEVDAHRIEPESDERVRVDGRIRVIDGGRITDSPAAWRFTVRGGRVVEIVPLDPAVHRLRRVA